MQHHLLEQQLGSYCRNVVMIYIGLVILVGLIGVWSVLPSKNKLTGLEGTWCNTSNPRYSYEFRSNGRIDVRSLGSKTDIFLTWARIGDVITITNSGSPQKTMKEWTFKGQLIGKEIKGIATARTRDDTDKLSHNEVWVREQASETVEITPKTVRQVPAVT